MAGISVGLGHILSSSKQWIVSVHVGRWGYHDRSTCGQGELYIVNAQTALAKYDAVRHDAATRSG